MEHHFTYNYNKRLQEYEVFVDGIYEGSADTTKAAKMLGHRIKRTLEELENG